MGEELHECPKRGCPARIPFNRMACIGHWYSLPPPLRVRVSRAWRDGDISAILEARQEVVRLLNA